MNWVAEEHAMWHTFHGVPTGPLGGTCPWDACGWLHAELADEADYYCDRCQMPGLHVSCVPEDTTDDLQPSDKCADPDDPPADPDECPF